MAQQYKIGQTVPSRFEPSIVAASYFASLCGCLLTAELLHRRGTALRNLRSWLETIACAISMGLVGIWCMHFIGNRAIILGDGNDEIQLVYNAGYTTLSVFLPIMGLSIAFSAAEYSSHSKALHWVGLVCTGVFSGLSIVGMHYIGNFAVTNYALHYQARYLAASIIISIGDCLLVLISFYTLREEWISAWWKRVLCAIFLAGGVSAMHFTASTDCKYVLKNYNAVSAIRSRNIQVIIAGALAGAAAVILLCIHLFSRYRATVLRKRSQKVMLACALFDPSGRIMITTEGVLPSREITDKYNHRSFNEDFDTAHHVFHWVFRVTYNWSGVSELIPRMKSHLRARKDLNLEETMPASSHSSAIYDPETYSDYSIIFRERFCAAAASLASAMHMPVEELGVLYDNIVQTGTLRVEDKASCRGDEARPLSEVEAALRMSVFGKGQLMFITRELTDEEARKLLNAGYKFASVQHVGNSIAFAMQIPFAMLEKHLARLKSYNEQTRRGEKSGTWLGFFAMIPKPNRKGFDIAVKRESQDQIPDVQLLPSAPTQWQVGFLNQMDGWKVAQCVSWLEDRSKRHGVRTPIEQEFAGVLRNAVVALFKQFPKEWHEWVREARFYSKQQLVHYSHPTTKISTGSILYAFTVIGNTHTTSDSYSAISGVPMSFFNVRHRCYTGSPDHAIFARDVHQEFGPLLARRVPRQKNPSLRTRLSSNFNFSSSRKSPIKKSTSSPGRSTLSRCSSVEETDEHGSVHELVDKPAPPVSEMGSSVTSDHERTIDWGGILVNSETIVKTDSKMDFSTAPSTFNQELSMTGPFGVKIACGTAEAEVTFVDELVAITKARFLPAKL